MVELNASQKQRILVTLVGLHRSLAETEALLVQAEERSPLAAFRNDLSPTQAKVIRDYFARIRSEVRQAIQRLDIPVQIRRVNLSWHLQTLLVTEDVSIADISPEHLRGYGKLEPEAAELVNQVEQNLYRAIGQLQKYLRELQTQDLQARILRLGEETRTATDLASIERIITKHGLVEFRPMLEMTIRRLELPRFEIAVFGRVNTGKSSLLNHILGADLLPVGVNPVTAVPTRLLHGEQALAFIRFAEAERQQVDVSELHEYVTESDNPGNAKRVIEVAVQYPSPNLPEGIVMVDTPGTGSLAAHGSAETFAYLPRCDHAVVLIDAGTTLTQDDLTILRQLYEAAIPASVLLSKSDLLSESDLASIVSYIETQLEREFSFRVQVFPVSTVGANESLLFQWFEQEIRPQFAQFRTVAEKAVRRKVGHLRESVAAALRTLARDQLSDSDGRPSHVAAEVQGILESADKQADNVRRRCRDWRDDSSLLPDVAFDEAAQRTCRAGKHDASTTAQFMAQGVANCLIRRGAEAYELVSAWRQSLVQALDDTHRAVPGLESIDPAGLQGFALSGLPIVDSDALESHFSRLDGRLGLRGLMGQGMVKRLLVNRFGEEVQKEVSFYDRRLQAWLNDNVTQIRELYESQAELARHWLRARAGASDDATPSGTNIQELQSDLHEMVAGRSPPVPKQHEATVKTDGNQPPRDGSNGWKPDDNAHSAAKVNDNAQPDDDSGSGWQFE